MKQVNYLDDNIIAQRVNRLLRYYFLLYYFLNSTAFCKNGYFRLKKRHFRFSVPEIAITMI